MEELQARHRKEQRELQARITQKKKNATKKTRKGVNDECDSLQGELEGRQQAEVDALDPELATTDIKQLDITGLSLESTNDETRRNGTALEVNGKEDVDELKNTSTASASAVSIASSQNQSKKPNRQKARLARRAAEQEALTAQATEEAVNLPDLREQEMTAMEQHMKQHGLKEISIRPDGHCLYSAVAAVLPEGQLSAENADLKPYQVVRSATAGFISTHPDDFEAFLEEPLQTYVSKINNTAEWGGQLELQAIARAYGVPINVLQADGRVEKIELEEKSAFEPMWLAYYRHSFGLGEHYNALKKAG